MPVNNIFISITGVLLFALAIAFTSGCDRSEAYILVPQYWNEDEILVEIRPGAPSQGMNEFVLVATNSKTGVPGYEYIVSIKMDTDDRWQQMIQDGHSGVYRRAIAVNDPVNGVLVAQLRHKREKNKTTELSFPLAKHVTHKK